MPVKDMAGCRFTRLVVTARAPSDKNGNARWHCQCDCGNVTVSSGFTLRNGEAKSCGCLTAGQLKARNTTHKKSKTPEYRVWADMMQRCTNPNDVRYDTYGLRGIKVCGRWRDFANFHADMGKKPSPAHSIDRIDNDGDYEPSNCRWATRSEQDNNTSRNHYVTYRGQRVSVTKALEMSGSGVLRRTVFSRLRYGWSIEEAVDIPTGAINPLEDLTGQRFERLEVLSRAPNGANNSTRWNCYCDCGTDLVVHASNLHSGASKSCGCYTGDMLRTPGRVSRRHKRQRHPSAK